MIRRPPPSVVHGVRTSIRGARRLSGSTPSGTGGGSSPRHNPPPHNDAAAPWWSLAAIHEKVASAIASSLPDESLSAVHRSLSEKLGEGGDRPSVSIGEAIVSARAQELHHKQQQQQESHANNAAAAATETQKQLEEEIEKRAMERAEERMRLELRAMEERLKRREEERLRQEKEERQMLEKERERERAFAKWKEDAEKEREMEEKRGSLVQTEMEEPMEGSADASEASKSEDHPVLGPQIARLPYKRIHLTSASTLASLPVYEKQRAYRHDRARVMAKDKKKTLWMGIPGVISLMEDDDGRLSILDGQHRVGMMALLGEEQRKLKLKEKGGTNGIALGGSGTNDELARLDLNNVLVEVFFPPQSTADKNDVDSVLASGQKQNDDDLAAAIFTEINKAEPIKLLDLPGVAPKRTRDVIDHAASHFRDAFPAMFSSSQRCRAPHLNLDNLREALFASDVLTREKIGSGGELVRWMTVRNDELRERYGADEGEGGRTLDEGKKLSGAALRKARKHDFYLGLESTWLYK